MGERLDFGFAKKLYDLINFSCISKFLKWLVGLKNKLLRYSINVGNQTQVSWCKHGNNATIKCGCGWVCLLSCLHVECVLLLFLLVFCITIFIALLCRLTVFVLAD